MPSLSRDGGPAAVPKYQRIAAALRYELDRAARVPGGRLPSERSLAARYQVNRQTIRAALQQLRADGLIVTGRRGTRPAASAVPVPVPVPAIPAPVPAGAALAPRAAEPAAPGRSRLVLVSVPPSYAALLGMRGGERTLVHHRRELGPGGETVQHAVTYLSPRAVAEAPELARLRERVGARDQDLGPLHRWLDRAAAQGQVSETITMTRTSRPPAAASAPVCGLAVRRALYDRSGRLLAVTDLAFPAWDRLTLHRDRAAGGFRVT